jgi:hypothetical protein
LGEGVDEWEQRMGSSITLETEFLEETRMGCSSRAAFWSSYLEQENTSLFIYS